MLVTSGLGSLLTLIDLSRAVLRHINFGWALVYNCVAVPIAAGASIPLSVIEPCAVGSGVV